MNQMLKDYVICQICNKKFKAITPAHLRTHNTTMKEYRQEFPNAEIFSEVIRNKKSKIMQGNSYSKGNVPWNKGLTIEDPRIREGTEKTTKTLRKLAKENKLNPMPGVIAARKVNLGRKPWNTGLTKETDNRLKTLSENMLGEKNVQYGKPAHNRGIPTSENINTQIGNSLKQTLKAPKMRVKWSNNAKKNWQKLEYRANIHLSKILSEKSFNQLHKGFIVLSGHEKQIIDKLLNQGYSEKDFIKEGVQRIVINGKYPTWPKIRDKGCYKLVYQPTENEKDQLKQELLEKVQLKCLGDFNFIKVDIISEYHPPIWGETILEYYLKKRKKLSPNVILIVISSLNYIDEAIQYITDIIEERIERKDAIFRIEVEDNERI